MNDKKSKVSIIIPTFNSEKHLEETLQSVSDQSYSNWECIIVDDGSGDATEEIAAAFWKQDNRFKFVKREALPKGGSHCRNIGAFNHATGEYLMFLDSDDLLGPTCVENRVHHFKQHPDLDFIAFTTNKYREGGGNSIAIFNPKRENPIKEFLSHTLPLPWITICVIWNVESFKKLKGFDVAYPRLQDVELHTRALLSGYQYRFVEMGEPDTFYRVFVSEEREKKFAKIGVKIFEGVMLYISKIGQIMNSQRRTRDLKYLKAMYFFFLGQFIFGDNKKIDLASYITLFKEVFCENIGFSQFVILSIVKFKFYRAKMIKKLLARLIEREVYSLKNT